MDSSTNLPVLKVIDSCDLLTHEESDPRRVETLRERIKAERILKNPPIIAPIPDTGKYVVLDGANRTTAFKELQIPHIIAQLVDYKGFGIKLETWYHVVAGMDRANFCEQIESIDNLDLEEVDIGTARQALASGDALAYLVFADSVQMVAVEDRSHFEKLKTLRDIVAVYRGKANIFRASNDEWEKQFPFYPGITALVIFPPLVPDDVMLAMQNGYKIPSGVTRHVIPYRALNINIPLQILKADWGIERKEKWLDDWWMERMAANAIRFYAEPTFTFNE
jgi:hypothetical protein